MLKPKIDGGVLMFSPIIILWLISFMFSFGVAGFIYIAMKAMAKKPWRINIDENYRPRISIIVPIYNEERIIHFKLQNLAKVKYPKDLMKIIIVDSNSTDNTVSIIKAFSEQHSDLNLQVVIQKEKLGKSAALNYALKNCEGDVIIVSDADCFWPPDILEKSLPFLADESVGAISGPKILLNSNQSWVTESEDTYVNLHNQVKLGESKIGSTVFFEGGFGAYKKEVLESFDPYNTGSDDSGTVIKILENNKRALLVPEAKFYSAFPLTWREKINIKIRRANQLVRVFITYIGLLLKRQNIPSKLVVLQNAFLYLIGPIAFILFLIFTGLLLLKFPHLALIFLILLIPKVGSFAFEMAQNYFILFLTLFSVALGKKIIFWSKPADRTLLSEEILRAYMLI